MLRSILSSLLLVACTSSAQSPLRKPDGSWHLTCAEMMDRCVQQAEDLCKGRGYVVISGMSKRTMYGAELGVSQIEKRDSELDVACADRRGDLPTVLSASAAPSTSPAPSAVPAPTIAPPPAPSVVPAPTVTPAPSVAPAVNAAPAPIIAPTPSTGPAATSAH